MNASKEVASRDFGETSAATSAATGDALVPHRGQTAGPSFNREPHLLQNIIAVLCCSRNGLPDTVPLPSVQRDFSTWPFVEDDIGMEFRVSIAAEAKRPV
jgi:hypothetical protein